MLNAVIAKLHGIVGAYRFVPLPSQRRFPEEDDVYTETWRMRRCYPGYRVSSRQKVYRVRRPKSEGGCDTLTLSGNVLSLNSSGWARAGVLAKCPMPSGLLRNSEIPLGCQPEDQGRLRCTNVRHQTLTWELSCHWRVMILGGIS